MLPLKIIIVTIVPVSAGKDPECCLLFILGQPVKMVNGIHYFTIATNVYHKMLHKRVSTLITLNTVQL